jgi:hypothetical protein
VPADTAKSHSALDRLFVEKRLDEPPGSSTLPSEFNRVQTKDTSDSTGAAFHVMQDRLAGTDTYWHPFHRAARRQSFNNSPTMLACKSRRFQHLSQLKRHICAACDGRMHGVDFLRQAGVARGNRSLRFEHGNRL